MSLSSTLVSRPWKDCSPSTRITERMPVVLSNKFYYNSLLQAVILPYRVKAVATFTRSESIAAERKDGLRSPDTYSRASLVFCQSVNASSRRRPLSRKKYIQDLENERYLSNVTSSGTASMYIARYEPVQRKMREASSSVAAYLKPIISTF
jgi:hypothetical protein